MQYPDYRTRRLRRTSALRRLIRETRPSREQLIAPLHIVAESGGQKAGLELVSPEHAGERARGLMEAGVGTVYLTSEASRKDAVGSEAWSKKAALHRAVQAIKAACPQLVVIAEVAFSGYTTARVSGVMVEDRLDNDATLENLARAAVSLAAVGVDVVATSSTLDGAVAACRESLDADDFEDVALLAVSAAYESVFAGASREADASRADLDPANVAEAIREVTLDVAEGADLVAVEPALTSLDVVRALADEVDVPVVAIVGAGMWSLFEAAIDRDGLDRERLLLETLSCMVRAGASAMVTPHSELAARALSIRE